MAQKDGCPSTSLSSSALQTPCCSCVKCYDSRDYCYQTTQWHLRESTFIAKRVIIAIVLCGSKQLPSYSKYYISRHQQEFVSHLFLVFFTFLFSSSFQRYYLIHKRIKGLFDICFFKGEPLTTQHFQYWMYICTPRRTWKMAAFYGFPQRFGADPQELTPLSLWPTKMISLRGYVDILQGVQNFFPGLFLSRHGLVPIKSLSRKKSTLYFKWPLFLMKQ